MQICEICEICITLTTCGIFITFMFCNYDALYGGLKKI